MTRVVEEDPEEGGLEMSGDRFEVGSAVVEEGVSRPSAVDPGRTGAEEDAVLGGSEPEGADMDYDDGQGERSAAGASHEEEGDVDPAEPQDDERSGNGGNPLDEEGHGVGFEEINGGVVDDGAVLVAWRVEDLYDEATGELLPRYQLRTRTPTLVLVSEDGGEVAIALTKGLASQLGFVMADAVRGYYGMPSKRAKLLDAGEFDDRSWWKKTVDWVVDNRMKAVAAAALAAVTIFAFLH